QMLRFILTFTSSVLYIAETRFIAPCALKARNTTEEVYTTLPRFSAKDLPTSWDWRDVDGENMVTTDRSYSNPRACSGCWAFATVHALSDRIKIQRNAAFPEVNLSPQPLLTCGYEIGNGCRGGGVIDAMRYIKEKGITDETCSPFTARGHDTGDICLGSTVCSTCSANGACEIPKKYDIFHVDEFGTVSGEAEIQSEIKARGPVVCHMHVDEAFRSNYRAGAIWTFSATDDSTEPNHAAEIAGWGVDDDGTPYWIARFAFGTNWGDHGWAKLHRSANGHIENAGCVWATV
ncbi:Cathepsin Z precursor, putative, partial [Perkinsus marinus ATCC 50983]